MKKIIEFLKKVINAIGTPRFLRFSYVALAVLILACMLPIVPAIFIVIGIAAVSELLVWLDAEDRHAAIMPCVYNFLADWLGMMLGGLLFNLLTA